MEIYHPVLIHSFILFVYPALTKGEPQVRTGLASGPAIPEADRVTARASHSMEEKEQNLLTED